MGDDGPYCVDKNGQRMDKNGNEKADCSQYKQEDDDDHNEDALATLARLRLRNSMEIRQDSRGVLWKDAVLPFCSTKRSPASSWEGKILTSCQKQMPADTPTLLFLYFCRGASFDW